MILFPFRPNWVKPILERLAWRSNLQVADAGNQQARALREVPRRYFEWEIVLQRNSLCRFNSDVWAHQHEKMLFPIWIDRQRSQNNAASGVSSLAVSTAYSDFHADGKAVVGNPEGTSEIVEIESLTADSLTLKDVTSNPWPKGTSILPLREGYLASEVDKLEPTDRVSTVLIQAELTDNSAVDPGTLGGNYLGLDVLQLRPHRAKDLKESITRKVNRLDNGIGPVLLDPVCDHPTLGKSLNWLLHTRESIWAFRRWLQTRRGKTVPFNMPSWQQDIYLTQSIGASDVYIYIERQGYSENYDMHPSRRDLAFIKRDNTFINRRIVGATVIDDSTERLELDNALGFDASQGNFWRISYLGTWRLEADAIELSWMSNRVVQIALNTRTAA
jgi:hypothetical protein